MIYWDVKMPVISRRDYVYEQRFHFEQDHDGTLLRCSSSQALPLEESLKKKPVPEGVVRIDDYRSHFIMWAGSSPDESRFIMLYFEDSKTNVPNFVIRSTTASAVPKTLARIAEAGKKYPVERVQAMLARFEINMGVSDCDSEDFFSADEDGDSPGHVGKKRRSRFS